MPEGQAWKRHVDHIRELGEQRVRSPTPNLTSGSAEDGPVANPQPVPVHRQNSKPSLDTHTKSNLDFQ